MPPFPQPNDRNQEQLPPLSDEDVSLLHNIVLRAQDQDEFKTRPKKAVFDAYDAIFTEHGLHTNHDRACLRLLFQLVGPDADPRTSLYERFEQLLSRAGITLDHGDGDISVALSEGSVPQEAQGPRENGGLAVWQASPKRAQRRNSFTSIYDATAEIERFSKRRPPSRASISHVQEEKSSFQGGQISGSMAQGSPPKKSFEIRQSSLQYDVEVERPWLHRHDMRNQNLLSNNDGQYLARNQYYSYTETEDSKGSTNEAGRYLEEGHALPIVPVSQTQLVRDSGSFDKGRIRILAKKYLRKWFIQTYNHNNKFSDLEDEAAQKDRLTLQRQAFESWLVAHRHLRQEMHMKQQFRSLADKRNSSLMGKAFSHWVLMTVEAKASTNAARQKYLRVKYFNAWHLLTATNDLKVAKQSVKAPFHLLRKRAVQYYQDEVDALELYYHNLTKMIFWRWALARADYVASKMRTKTLTKRVLLIWMAKVKDRDEQERVGRLHYERISVQTALKLWLTHTRIDLAGDHQADAFRNRRLEKTAFAQWKLATRLAPLEKGVTRMRDWRITRSTFGFWLLRTRMAFRADWVEALRTKQNAFTAWNERLRRDAVQARIDNRILAQAMYKWVIAQRAILMTRIRQEREKRAAFSKLLVGFKKHQDLLQSQETQVKDLRLTRLARSTVECWKLQMSLTSARSQMAVEFYAPKIQQDLLATWRNKHENIQKLEKWAKDASFYFLIMKTIRRWCDAASDAKKRRMNENYRQIRRQVKMNLARRVLIQWRNRVNGIKSSDYNCERLRGSKNTDLLRALVFHWQNQTLQRHQAVADASIRFDTGLLKHSLDAWIGASRNAIYLQTRADQFYHIHLSEFCSTKLRRLSMKAFGIKRRQQDADAMKERYWTKHVRNILKHWGAQSKDVTYQALVHGSYEPTDAGYGTASQDEPPGAGIGTTGQGTPLATNRGDSWTSFDADLLYNDDWLAPPDELEAPQVTSTPMPTPGYLNTPSKRAARAKALAKMSTTPATPLTTPFAARLRAGMASSPVLAPGGDVTKAKKDVARRSGLGVGVQTIGEDQHDLDYETR